MKKLSQQLYNLMEMLTYTFKLGIIGNHHSHWVLASENARTIHPLCPNDRDVTNHSSCPPVVNRVALDDGLFADLVQKIQVPQWHKAKVCRSQHEEASSR